jgi:hypothetical protein
VVLAAAVAIIMNFDLFVFSVAPSPTALLYPSLSVCAVPGRRIDPSLRARETWLHICALHRTHPPLLYTYPELLIKLG